VLAIRKRVMLNGVPREMIENTKIEIKIKNFNRKDSFLTLQCIECTISNNFFIILVSLTIVPGAPFSIFLRDK
jgi:hypothetical protein